MWLLHPDSSQTLATDAPLSFGGRLTGRGNLVKTGTGILTLTGSNTFISTTNPGIRITAGGLVGDTTSLTNTIELAAGTTLELPQATSGTYASAIDGSGAILKTGAGTIVLTGFNTHSGTTTISAGGLELGGAGGWLNSQTIVNDSRLAFSRTSNPGGSLPGTITGTGVVEMKSGRFILGGTNSYSGGTLLTGGTLQVRGNDVLGTTGTISFEGGTLEYDGATADWSSRFSNEPGQQYRIGGTGSVTLASPLTSVGGSFAKIGSAQVILTGANTYDGGTTVEGSGSLVGTTTSLQGGIVNNAIVIFDQGVAGTYAGSMSGSGSLTKTGTGAVTLSGTSSYSGGTTVSGGRLIGTTASLQGAITNTAAVEFSQATSGTYAGNVTGSGSLTKSGVGNLILTGSSNHTGPTSVAGGRLSVNGVLGNSPIQVLLAAELGGSGEITGPVTIQNGGTLSPGNSIESLATGTTSFATGATFEYEVDSTDVNNLAAAADLLRVSGNLDITSGALLTLTDLNLTPNPFIEDTTIFALINYSGAWNGGLFTYGSTVLADGSRFMVGSQQWEIDYNLTSATGLANFTSDYLPSSSFVAITAVPEPGTLVLAGVALLWLACGKRMRRS